MAPICGSAPSESAHDVYRKCDQLDFPALAHLQNTNNGTVEGLTNDEASWVGSMMPLGAIVGSIPAGFLADALGRKMALLMLSVPYLLGWILIIVADHGVAMLYTGRFISGFSIGATTVVIPLYCEEISEVSIRGMLGCYLDFMITIGFLWTYILNTFLDYFDLTISSAVLPAAFLLSFIWMPESPVYLLAKNRDDKAVKALRFFRGAKYIKDFDHRPEIEVMRDFTKEGATYSGGTTTSLGYIKECLFKLGPVSTTAKAMRIIFGLVIIAQATGIQGVIYYTVEIFQSGESSISPYICNFVVAIVQFLLSLLTVMVVDRVGRRLLLLLSGAGMAVSIAFLAMHFLMIDNKSYMANFGWMPCVTVTLFISTYASGFGPLPWLVMAEIVPTESKGWVSSICVFLSWSLQFITTKLYSIMVSEMGEPITYAIFCLFCVLSVVYVAVYLPETSNKTRAQIQSELQGKLETTKL